MKIHYLKNHPIISYPLFLLIIFFSSFTFAEEYQASTIPWSGYWWPFTEGGLATGNGYRGFPSPLEKYEMLTSGYSSGPSVSWYKTNYYDPDALAWYGHCGDWSRAASFNDITFYPSSENNIVFRVGDKKGLLTLAHDNDVSEWGSAESPDEFHYWLLHYIKDQKKIFIADLDAGDEIWNYPIYRYVMESTVNGSVESVTVTIYYASDNVHPDYMGILERQTTYTYNLFLDSTNGITGGEWTGDSISQHPQRLFFTLAQRTTCPYIDYEEIVRLANARDDYLETPGQTVPVNPGTYHLVLMDEDKYRINCSPRDKVSVTVEKQDGSGEDILAVITDNSGIEMERAVIGTSAPMQAVFIADKPPYTLTLTQGDYADPNIYSLKTDLIKTYTQHIPYIPKNGMWSGFAATNPQSETAEIAVVAYMSNGEALQTIYGPLSIEPYERKLFLFNNLDWRTHEFTEIDSLTFMADAPVNLVNLFGGTQSELSCFMQDDLQGTHLVIPDIIPPMTIGSTMFGNVTNQLLEESPVTLRLYSGAGSLVKEAADILAPKENLFIKPGYFPFYSMPNSGWIEIQGETGSVLNGYQYISHPNKIETLFALKSYASRQIVPNIPPPGAWTTTLTLINPNDQYNTVNLHLGKADDEDSENDMNLTFAPKEKQTIELQDQFGKNEGDDLYLSLLEVQGELPVAGYFTYSYGEDDDTASIPLLTESDLKNELILPHYAGPEQWWTGFGLCNPGVTAVTILATPYNNEGNAMTGTAKTIQLDPGAYMVSTVYNAFPENTSTISFIKFAVQEQEGIIGGFYLYGNNTLNESNTKMLSGAKM